MAGLAIDRAKEPKNVQGTPTTSRGEMANGDYYYVVTPINPFGEGVKGVESAEITITGGGGAGKNTLTWDAVAGASSYRGSPIVVNVSCFYLGGFF